MSQFAMASALHAAVVVWNQEVDVYAEHMGCYIAVMDLMAPQILTGRMQVTCANNMSTQHIFAT